MLNPLQNYQDTSLALAAGSELQSDDGSHIAPPVLLQYWQMAQRWKECNRDKGCDSGCLSEIIGLLPEHPAASQ